MNRNIIPSSNHSLLEETQKPMKVYSFHFAGGHIGGTGVVIADSINKAVELANESIESESWNTRPIAQKDLIEIQPNSCKILSTGDY